MTEASPARYDWRAIQDRWLPLWEKLEPFRAGQRPQAERKYVLDMFPYPSGDLHMGHAEAWAIGDVVARYWFGQGYDVLQPTDTSAASGSVGPRSARVPCADATPGSEALTKHQNRAVALTYLLTKTL